MGPYGCPCPSPKTTARSGGSRRATDQRRRFPGPGLPERESLVAARIDLLACAGCSHRELAEFPGARGVPEF